MSKFVVMIVLSTLYACASDQQSQEDLMVSDENYEFNDQEGDEEGNNEWSNENNVANENSWNNEDWGNNVADNNFNFNDTNLGENNYTWNDDAEFLNNAEGEFGGEEEFAFFNNQSQQVNNAPVVEEAETFVNNFAAGQSANEIPLLPATEAAPMPTGGGMVRYAPGMVNVYSTPDGNIVGALEQGDHPLVIEENGWLRMSDGRFVMNDGLRSGGVGRPRQLQDWQ